MRGEEARIPAGDQDEPQKAPAARLRLGLVGLLVPLLLPVSLAAAVLLLLARRVSLWNLKTPLGLAAFAILLVALSFVLSAQLDAWTLARPGRQGRRLLLNRTSPCARTVKLVLGSVVVPIAVLVAANRSTLPNQQTPMALAVELGAVPSGAPEERLPDAVLRAPSSDSRARGILALATLGSDEALAQLVRILRDDPRALRGGNESMALSSALASFGARARPALLRLMDEARVGQGPAPAPVDLLD